MDLLNRVLNCISNTNVNVYWSIDQIAELVIYLATLNIDDILHTYDTDGLLMLSYAILWGYG